MYYNYKCGNQNITVVRYDDTDTSVRIYFGEGKTCNKPILGSGDKKHFIFDDTVVYIKDWIRPSLEDFYKKLNEKVAFTDDFVQMIMNEGIDNLIFMLPLNTIDISFMGIGLANGDDFKIMPCMITERQYKLSENYKLEFKVLDEAYTGDTIQHRSFYICDFISILKQENYKVIRKNDYHG